ncbi:hypothetical protein JUNP479_0755 [Aeromonas jandaei]|nr:hypothetical protein JUNP479_0755 [Aeromonas jandaei]
MLYDPDSFGRSGCAPLIQVVSGLHREPLPVGTLTPLCRIAALLPPALSDKACWRSIIRGRSQWA